MPEGRLLIIEPYAGGSHRHLVHGWATRRNAPTEVWTTPGNKWKWRMRASAPLFAARLNREPRPYDVIFASSMLDAACFRGLLAPPHRDTPLVVYFHENQLTYPVRAESERDYHYGFTHITTTLAAHRLAFNSAYNRESFLAAAPAFLRRMPPPALDDIEARVRAKSVILPVPIDATPLVRPARVGPPVILWNHRWEHDKDPETFFAALAALAGEGLDFRVSVLGEGFRDIPPIFERARAELGERVLRWGYLADEAEYRRALAEADWVVSTARHEFQGLAVLEAAAQGAVPIVPDDLAYREIWPPDCRYPPGLAGLERRLRAALASAPDEPLRPQTTAIAQAHDWSVLLPRFEALCDNLGP